MKINLLQLKRCFSLIELLFIISVLAVLSSILIPTLQKTITIVHMTSCKSHEQQVFQAMTLYIEDSNGICPGPLWGGQLPKAVSKYGTAYLTLAGFLSPYLESISIPQKFSYLEQMVCPANKEESDYDMPYFDRVNYRTGSIKGFGRPFGYPKNSNGQKPYDPALYMSIPNPSKSVVIEDADIINYPVQNYVDRLPALPLHPNMTRNTLYFDGHLESLPYTP